MARIPDTLVEEIREKVNIVDVISPYVQLRKQGRNLFGVCPFHEERTGSFSVNEDKQIFHCFSCGRGGNVFSFLMDIDNLSFPQAVAKVAPMVGVDLDDAYMSDKSSKAVDPEVKAIQDLYVDASRLYHHILVNTEIGEPALDYLHRRGLDDATIDAFMLGYAPDNDVLLDYFQERQVDYQVLRQSELFISMDDGTLHDRFSNRVLFTIRNKNGQPIAYSGRRLSQDETQPKYINSPESILFNKSRELFNLDLAKNTIRKTKQVILFEGFMDVIAAFQAGVMNGVASMGTSLTLEQVQELSRLATNIHITYDSDRAGQAATKRALDLIGTNSQLNATIVHIPDDQDPDEFLRAHDVETFNQVLTHHTEDPIAFNIRFLRTDRDLTNQQEIFAYISDVLKVIAMIPEPVIRDTYVRQLATEFNVGVESLNDQLRPLLLQVQAGKSLPQRNSKSDSYQQHPERFVAVTPRQIISRFEQAERVLLAWMLQDSEVWLQVTSKVDFHFIDSPYETLMLLATAYKESHGNQNIDNMADFMDYVQRPELTRILATLDDVPEEMMTDRSQVDDYLDLILNKEPLSARINTLRRQIAEAKQVHNTALMAQLGAELITIRREQQAML